MLKENYEQMHSGAAVFAWILAFIFLLGEEGEEYNEDYEEWELTGNSDYAEIETRED